MDEHFAEQPGTPLTDPATDRPGGDPIGNPDEKSNPKTRRRRHSHTRRCSFCQCRELRRQSRTLVEELCFLQPYKCARCQKSNVHFRLNGWLPFHILFLLAIPLAIYSWNVLTELPTDQVNRVPANKPTNPENFILESNKEAETRK